MRAARGDDGGGGDGTGDDGTGDEGTGDDGTGDDGTGDDGTGDDGTGDDGTGDDGTGDDGTGDDGTGDEGTGDDGSGDIVTVTISGVVNFDATTESTAFCNITSWNSAAVDDLGNLDRTSYSEYDMQQIDCADHSGGDIAYEVDISADMSADVSFFAFVDGDGDPSTPDFQAQSDSNPFTIEPDGIYTDVNFLVPTEFEPPE